MSALSGREPVGERGIGRRALLALPLPRGVTQRGEVERSRYARGRVPSAIRLKAICDVLGLEFYVGPRRAPARADLVLTPDQYERLARGLNDATAVLDEADSSRTGVPHPPTGRKDTR